ncbi:MAG: HD domain-containing protein, partial [Halobacteriota archaeon]
KKEVYTRFAPLIVDLDGLDERFEAYLFHPQDSINRKILNAAHFYATKWEFDIIKHENWNDYEIDEIQRGLQRRQEALSDVEGLQKLALFPTYRSFVDLCGRLRFQVRWGQLYRVPRTSVLGHMLIVAILSYLFSLEIDACSKRRANNYFAGLFHDLPEVLTKDIISPVKRAATGVEAWQPEMRLFTEDEFVSKVTLEGKLQSTTSDEITASFNQDRYNPVDGELVKAADDLAAFMEAYLALQNGISNAQLQAAVEEKQLFYREKTIAGISFSKVYKSFK